LRAGQRLEHYETERLGSDGRRIAVSLTISPIKDDSGTVIGASKIVRDVTERRRMERERQNFVTLIENSTDFIAMCDMNGVPFFVNRAGLQMVGLDDIEAARATPVREFFFPEDQPKIMNEFFPRVVETGHGEIEIRFRHFKTGEARWMAYKVLLLRDEAGQSVGFATVSQDVTERRRLEDLARSLRLGAAVTFAGWQADVRRWLSTFDIFISPSRSEPFGLAVLEASAAGVPIVAYDEGGSAEIVANGETGLLARPGDVASLAGALLRLAKDADLRVALGRAGRRRVETAFNPGDAGRTFSRLLREIAVSAK